VTIRSEREKQTLDKGILLLLVLLLLVPLLYNYGFSLLRKTQLNFASFYYGAQIVFDEHRSPYDYALLSSAAEAELGEKPQAYLYAPPSLFVFYPLTFFAYQNAAALMLALNFALFLGIVLIVFKIGGYAPLSTWGMFIFVYMASYFSVMANLTTGQINLFILLLICCSWYLLKQERPSFSVAIPLAIAVVTKLYPALFLLYLVAKRRWPVVLWTLALILLLSAASYVFLPDGLWSDWVTKLLPTGGYGSGDVGMVSPADWENQSLHGFVTRLFADERYANPIFANMTLSGLVAYAVSGVLIVAYGVLAYQAGRSPSDAQWLNGEYALGLLTMVLVSPLSWTPHLVFVLPAAVIAVMVALTKGKRFAAALVGLSALLLAWRMPFVSIARALPRILIPLGVSGQFFALVCLWIYLAGNIRRRLRVRQGD